jgi:hypothetical protein
MHATLYFHPLLQLAEVKALVLTLLLEAESEKMAVQVVVVLELLEQV